MQLLDPDIQECRALVIDGNATSRSTLVGMLREFGLGTVAQCSRASDAMQILEKHRFDIVLCEHHFDQGQHVGYNGQDLLDELRKAQLLPYSTVFVMVTSEATYAKVAEAAESALDSYLLKPHTATALAERVRQARHRKKVLRPIFSAIERGEHAHAAALCVARYSAKEEYALYCARIGAELLLRLGKHETARKVFEAVRAAKPVPWARLGIARVELEARQPLQATLTLQELVATNPHFADGFDLLGRVLLDQGELEDAMAAFRRASDLTPANISRLQKRGTMAFYAGDAVEATRALDRAMITGMSSKTFDLQSLALLAMLRFDQDDGRGLQRVLSTLDHAVEQIRKRARPRPAEAEADAAPTPEEAAQQAAKKAADADAETRNQRLLSTVQVLHAIHLRENDRAAILLRSLALDIRQPDFDFEAAINLTALLSRLAGGALVLADCEDWLTRLATRFCVSKVSTDLLVAAAHRHPPSQAVVRQAQASITTMAERAMTHSVKGSPVMAVQTLIKQGSENQNAKLLELAQKVIAKHRDRIEMHAEMNAQAQTVLQRYCPQGTRVSLNHIGRSAGALVLRG